MHAHLLGGCLLGALLTVKLGIVLRFLTQAYAPGGVRAILIHLQCWEVLQFWQFSGSTVYFAYFLFLGNEAFGRRCFSQKPADVRRKPKKIGDRYDWTTGVPDNGNDWRKFRAVPRSYPLRSLVCTLFNKGGNRRAFRLPGEGGDHFHCTVEPSSGHIRCRENRRNPQKTGDWRLSPYTLP